jgi:WD40 repeat protein
MTRAAPPLIAALAALTIAPPLRAKEPAAGEVRRFAHGSHIYQVAVSPDGKLVATDDQVWEVATGKKVATLPLPARERRSYTRFRVAFSPDSRHVAVHRYYDLVLAEAATGKEVWRAELPPRGNTYEDTPGVAFTPDGKLLLAARNDEGLVRVFDTATGKEVRQFPYETKVGGLMGAAVKSFGVSADGKRVVIHSSTGGHLGGPAVFDVETGKELQRHRVSSVEAWVYHSAPTPDGRQSAYGRKNAVHLLDLETGKEVRRFDGAGRHVYRVAVSPDGKLIAAAMAEADRDEARVECWEVATGKRVRVVTGHKGVNDLAFTPDGKHLVTAGPDGTARLWRLTD